jgi:hypothetical protein
MRAAGFRFKIMLPSAVIFLLFFYIACSFDYNGTPVYDIDKQGIPQFIAYDYIELDKIMQISRFRSDAGHIFIDDFETEASGSMKHYFVPLAAVDPAAIKIYSPVDGTIAKLTLEWAGYLVEITPQDYPAFSIWIFHVNLNGNLHVGSKLSAGQELGTHLGAQTQSDVAVWVNTPGNRRKLLSYFEVMPIDIFLLYQNRGVAQREDLIIPKDAAEAEQIYIDADEYFTLN